MEHYCFSLTSNEAPIFAEPLPVGQLYVPSRETFRNAFDGIFERRFFTNHGPLVGKLDQDIANYLGVRHAICVTNGSVALMVACAAMDLSGSVIVPTFSFPASVQVLEWAGLEPIFCDIDPETHCICPKQASSLIREDTSAILGIHVWGRPCDTEQLEKLAQQRNIKIFYDACDAFGASHHNKRFGHFGELEIFSFHAAKVLSAAEGGCITTNDDQLAARLRTTRNFHSSHSEAESPLRINGKMTEAQAALALISLNDLEKNISHNKDQWQTYVQELDKTPGIKIAKFNDLEKQNYQYLVLQVDEQRFGLNRDQLLQVLRAENILASRYFYPAVHLLEPFVHRNNNLTLPHTEKLCQQVIQLPLGARCSIDAAKKISHIICQAHINSDELKTHFSSNP